MRSAMLVGSQNLSDTARVNGVAGLGGPSRHSCMLACFTYCDALQVCARLGPCIVVTPGIQHFHFLLYSNGRRVLPG